MRLIFFVSRSLRNPLRVVVAFCARAAVGLRDLALGTGGGFRGVTALAVQVRTAPRLCATPPTPLRRKERSRQAHCLGAVAASAQTLVRRQSLNDDFAHCPYLVPAVLRLPPILLAIGCCLHELLSAAKASAASARATQRREACCCHKLAGYGRYSKHRPFSKNTA